MSTFTAEIEVMPLKEILDPQGKAVKLGLANLGFASVAEVRIGKHIRLEVEANDEGQARKLVEEACQKLLVNRIVEEYRYTLSGE